MPRFVVLEHDHPVRHWDFMLEADNGLLTWRLSAPPAPQQLVQAERSADHRRLYLDYEGPISGGRGSVTRWDAGEFEWLEDTEARKIARLSGHRLGGIFRLERVSEEAWQGYLS